ncbi:hypothetical protein HK099_007336 [Clydaea vesicula]|uniref:Mediator complex subunit 15 KIX domain-containing protein n=1 Tax=Clydaea vesicula TaxID=447962 RepID=A0AAD5XY46_9FUNG|nr:hypothetical protein HK099_007336 [Clydaea vesicula]
MFGQSVNANNPNNNLNNIAGANQNQSQAYQQMLSNQQQLQLQQLLQHQGHHSLNHSQQLQVNQLHQQQLQQQRMLLFQHQNQRSQQDNDALQTQQQSHLLQHQQNQLLNINNNQNNQMAPHQSIQFNQQQQLHQNQGPPFLNEQERVSIIHKLIELLRTVIPPQAEERIQYLAQNLELKAFRTAMSREMYLLTIQQQMSSITQRRPELIGNGIPAGGLPPGSPQLDPLNNQAVPGSPHLMPGQSPQLMAGQLRNVQQASQQMQSPLLQHLQNQQQQVQHNQLQNSQQQGHQQMLKEQRMLQQQQMHLQQQQLQQSLLSSSGGNQLKNGNTNSSNIGNTSNNVQPSQNSSNMQQANNPQGQGTSLNPTSPKLKDMKNEAAQSSATSVVATPDSSKNNDNSSPKVKAEPANTPVTFSGFNASDAPVTTSDPTSSTISASGTFSGQQAPTGTPSNTGTTSQAATSFSASEQPSDSLTKAESLSNSVQSFFSNAGLPANSGGSTQSNGDTSVITAAVSGAPEMAPLYRNIQRWIDILHCFGSEKEYDMIKKLQGMKRMMEAQLEGFQLNQGIYYLTPDTVSQLQQNLIRFYQYAEALRVQNQRVSGVQQGMGTSNTNPINTPSGLGSNNSVNSPIPAQAVTSGANQNRSSPAQQPSQMPISSSALLNQSGGGQNLAGNAAPQQTGINPPTPQQAPGSLPPNSIQNQHMINQLGLNMANTGMMGVMGQQNTLINQLSGIQNPGQMMMRPQHQITSAQLAQMNPQQLQQLQQIQMQQHAALQQQQLQQAHLQRSPALAAAQLRGGQQGQMGNNNPGVRQNSQMSPQLAAGQLPGNRMNSIGASPVMSAQVMPQQLGQSQLQQKNSTSPPKQSPRVTPGQINQSPSMSAAMLPNTVVGQMNLNAQHQFSGMNPQMIQQLRMQQQQMLQQSMARGVGNMPAGTMGMSGIMGSQYMNLNVEQQNALKRQMEQQMIQNNNQNNNQNNQQNPHLSNLQQQHSQMQNMMGQGLTSPHLQPGNLSQGNLSHGHQQQNNMFMNQQEQQANLLQQQQQHQQNLQQQQLSGRSLQHQIPTSQQQVGQIPQQESIPQQQQTPANSNTQANANAINKNANAFGNGLYTSSSNLEQTPAPVSNVSAAPGNEMTNEENIDSLFDFNYESPPPTTAVDEPVDTSLTNTTTVGGKRSKPDDFDSEDASEKKLKAGESINTSVLDEFNDLFTSPVNSNDTSTFNFATEQELKNLQSKYNFQYTINSEESFSGGGDLFSSTSVIAVCNFKNISLIFKFNSKLDNDGAATTNFVDCKELDGNGTLKVLNIKEELEKIGVNNSNNKEWKLSEIFERLNSILLN